MVKKLLNSPVVRSVLIRAVRTFLQTFLAVLIAAPALNFSAPAMKAAGVAGLSAVLAMFHRVLDETPVPSLVDRTQAPAPTAAQPAAQPTHDVLIGG